jgi:hypothetical protein
MWPVLYCTVISIYAYYCGHMRVWRGAVFRQLGWLHGHMTSLTRCVDTVCIQTGIRGLDMDFEGSKVGKKQIIIPQLQFGRSAKQEARIRSQVKWAAKWGVRCPGPPCLGTISESGKMRSTLLFRVFPADVDRRSLCPSCVSLPIKRHA